MPSFDNIAYTQRGADAVTDSGGLAAIVAAMRALPNEEDLQESACSALGSMAASEEAKMQRAIVDTCAPAAIVAAMRAHSGAEELQANACRALRAIAYCSSCESAVVDAGGIRAIVAAMLEHSSSPDLLEEACGALANISAADGAGRLMAEAGSAKTIVAAMMAHPDNAGILSSGQRCLRVPSLLAGMDPGALDEIITRMQALPAQADARLDAQVHSPVQITQQVTSE